MNNGNIFKEAKRIIAADPAYYFPDGETRGGEWWFRRRADDHTPSCHILHGGAVKDFGDDTFRGSCLDVYAELCGTSVLEAAKRLAQKTGNQTPVIKGANNKKKADKPPAAVFTPAALAELNRIVKSPWVVDRFGVGVKGWQYHTAGGEVFQCVVRFEKDGKKQVLPFYFDGNKVQWGQALSNGLRILYDLHILSKHPDYSTLICEGEKAVEFAKLYLADLKLAMIATTWPGGCGAVDKIDWSPLVGRGVIVWPDNDKAGFKAAQRIAQILTDLKCSVRIIDPPSGACKSWDAADAEIDGYSAWFVKNLIEKAQPWTGRRSLADVAHQLRVPA